MPKKSKPVENDPKAAWQNDAETLNYEEALQALDLLLAKLQDESLPLSELQSSHQRAEIYLSRCERLLSETEQTVLQLDPETLTTDTFKQRKDAYISDLDLFDSGPAGRRSSLAGQSGIHADGIRLRI